MKKRISANMYSTYRIGYRDRAFFREELENGCLYSHGIYPTKITAEDLPESYINVYLYRKYCFLNAAGIKYLEYIPNHTSDNHLFKDDRLLISYNKAIVKSIDPLHFTEYEGYDEVVCGWGIVDFVKAASVFSNIDVSSILEEIEQKKIWYVKRNPQHNELPNEYMNFCQQTHILLFKEYEDDYNYTIEQQRKEIRKFCDRYKLTIIEEIIIWNRTELENISEMIDRIRNEGAEISMLLFAEPLSSDYQHNTENTIARLVRKKGITSSAAVRFRKDAQ